MFVLIWATLLFSVRGNSEGASVSERQVCGDKNNNYCITLPEGEITVEAGLCVVIPCSFTTSSAFTPKHLVWFKCEQTKQKCQDSDIIFNTNTDGEEVQSEFRGRVSLLEPDVTKRNCSIIINNLKKSDSGSYQFRVNGVLNGNQDGFTYLHKANVSVKDLSQKPTVMVPPLTEGQQTTLTCTAPGLCSGSDPDITWTWRRADEKDSHITGNITANQGQTSTLTFNPSAEHHGTEVTCKVRFNTDTATEETVTLNVTYVKEVKITGNKRVKEGETLNLTCSVESFPPSHILWTKLSDLNMNNGSESDFQKNTSTDQQGESGKSSYTISNVTAEDSGQYVCTAKHLNKTLKENVEVTVIYKRDPGITGATTVQDGDVLNLTCSVESFPPSIITWTKLNFHNTTALQTDTGSATLFIPNVTVEDAGQYICSVKYQDTTVIINADVNVTWFSKILKNSGCEVHSDVLTCVCISEGSPLPTIKWPLLNDYTEYSITTTVSNHTVKSTITLTAKNHNYVAVECVSNNVNGEAKENLTVTEKGATSNLSKITSWLETIVAFLIGILLTTIIFCLVTRCYRKKQNSSRNLAETLEMGVSQDPLIYNGRVVEDDHTCGQEGTEDGPVAAEETGPELNTGPKDAEYASIDFSVLKRRSNREPQKMKESTETEYAEIKKEVREEREDDGGQEDEMLEGTEEGVVIEEDEETEHYVSEEKEEEDMAVHSNVKEIMGNM